MSHNPRDLILTFGLKHKNIPELRFITDAHDDLSINRVGDGSINYIYLVQSADRQNSIIIKYGEEEPSSELSQAIYKRMNLFAPYCLQRQEVEYNCLKLINNACPGSVPMPYVLDKEFNIIAMEYLENMEVLGPTLCKGNVDPDLAAKLGTILGHFHHQTHRKVVSHQLWQEFHRSLSNEKMMGMAMFYKFNIFEDYKEGIVLDPPDPPQFTTLLLDLQSRGIFQEIKKLYTQEYCLSHLDANSFSAMFSQHRAVFLDFEYSGLGHHSYSLGFLLPFYYMAMADTRNERSKNDKVDLIDRTKRAMRNMVEAFLGAFGEKVHILGQKTKFISEFAAFFGHTLFTFAPLKALPAFIQTDNSERKKFVEQGYQLMCNYNTISTIDDMFRTLFI